jgi:hypothetical protein
MAKLVEKQVLDIRKSNLKYSELSKIYGISIQQISNIANRATWKHKKMDSNKIINMSAVSKLLSGSSTVRSTRNSPTFSPVVGN